MRIRSCALSHVFNPVVVVSLGFLFCNEKMPITHPSHISSLSFSSFTPPPLMHTCECLDRNKNMQPISFPFEMHPPLVPTDVPPLEDHVVDQRNGGQIINHPKFCTVARSKSHSSTQQVTSLHPICLWSPWLARHLMRVISLQTARKRRFCPAPLPDDRGRHKISSSCLYRKRCESN